MAERTIPTRVGRTAPPRTLTRSGSDHPHAGGENGSYIRYRLPDNGPSPRGWGEPAGPAWSILSRRTIPTRVGRTPLPKFLQCSVSDHPHAGGENWAMTEKPRLIPDHPHAGGENTVNIFSLVLNCGPSPRGWGEPPGGYCRDGRQRTIPTRVGRTSKWGETVPY